MLRRFVVVGLFVVMGCSAEAAGPSQPSVRISGSVGGGGAVHTQSFGNLNVAHGGLHVAARQLVHRGVDGAIVDATVGPDGRWTLDLGNDASRWVVTVDGTDGETGHSALVSFGDGSSAIEIGKDVNATIDIGNLQVIGGEARTSVKLADYSIAQTTVLADEVFEAADGALVEAQAAVEAAEKAAEEAEKAAADAEAAAAAAQKAAEDAQKLAGK